MCASRLWLCKNTKWKSLLHRQKETCDLCSALIFWRGRFMRSSRVQEVDEVKTQCCAGTSYFGDRARPHAVGEFLKNVLDSMFSSRDLEADTRFLFQTNHPNMRDQFQVSHSAESLRNRLSRVSYPQGEAGSSYSKTELCIASSTLKKNCRLFRVFLLLPGGSRGSPGWSGTCRRRNLQPSPPARSRSAPVDQNTTSSQLNKVLFVYGQRWRRMKPIKEIKLLKTDKRPMLNIQLQLKSIMRFNSFKSITVMDPQRAFTDPISAPCCSAQSLWSSQTRWSSSDPNTFILVSSDQRMCCQHSSGCFSWLPGKAASCSCVRRWEVSSCDRWHGSSCTH